MKTLNVLLTSLIVANSVSVYADNNAKYQQCAVDLCGPSSKYARILANGVFGAADRDTKSYITQEIDPKLEKLLETSLKQKKDAYSIADVYVKSAGQQNIYQKSLLGILVSINRIKKVFNECIVSPDGRRLQVSASKLQEKMPNLSATDVSEITSILNAFLSTDGFTNATNVSSYTYDLFIEDRGIYAPAFFAQLKAKALALVEKLGPYVETRLNFPLLDRMIKADSLSASEKTEAIRLIDSVYRLSGMTDEKVQAVVGPLSLSPQGAAKALTWDENFKKFNLFVSSPKNMKVQRDKVLNSCRESIAKSMAATPSALRQRKAIELLQSVKASALAVAPRYFSGNSLNVVEKAIQTVKFTFPKNAQEVKDKTQGSFLESSRLAERLQSLFDKAESDVSVQQSIGLFALIGDVAETEKIFEGVQEFCDKLAPPHFEDTAFWNLGTIRTSWQSNMFPELGVGVLAHELGHIISRAVKNESVGSEAYKETRTCAATTHAVLAKSSDIKAFAQFEEEDWADSFALTTINHLQKSWPYAENFACALIEQDDKIKDRSYKGLQLLDESNADTHSSSFLRALQVQAGLGKPIPASCLKVMTENEKTAVGKVCGK